MSISVSVVVPVYRNAQSLRELWARIRDTLTPSYPDFELILIDDGSPDDSWAIIQEISRSHQQVKGLRLSRNFGQHPAIAAGFDRASGDVVVLMDADLEDQPECLPELIGRLNKDVDIVYTIKAGDSSSGFTRFTSSMFHRLFSYATRTSVPQGIGTMRAFNRKVLYAIRSYPEHNVLFGPLMFFIGFPYEAITVERDRRRHGESSYTFLKRLSLAARSLTSYTDILHQAFLVLGAAIVALVVFYGLIVALQSVFMGVKLPPGLTLILLINVFAIGIMMVGFGVVGNYVYRVYQEVLNRPRYLVAREVNFSSGMGSHPSPSFYIKQSSDAMSKSTIDANIEVHTRMADRYDSEEPHFRSENQQKVRDRLKKLRLRAPGGRLLDVGCGTGFIVHLAADIFDEIHGVDITPAMMARIQKDKGNITLHESRAENMPFPDASFDAVTAYSFVDHVEDQGALLREIARVLKPGGVFYADLMPHRQFWRALSELRGVDPGSLSDIVSRETAMVVENDKKVEEQFGIEAETFRRAEPGKAAGGIDPVELREVALRSGFRVCETSYDWYLGQGAVMHGQSFADSEVIEGYLRRALPLTNHLFKYVYIHAVR